MDGQVDGFKELCAKWNISYDRFIRTTDAGHELVSQEIFSRVLENGDIYLGKYEGLYCIACEAFYPEKDIKGGLCPVHARPVESVSEESYFFKMSKYQSRLLDYYEKNPLFISPARRKQEIVNRVKEGLKDLSVSRTSFDWGIKLRNDPKHVIYVWFDALINYLSGVDYPGARFKKFWPADIHLIGKDILWFHSVIWPAMLFSAGIEPPHRVFVHGFINTASGEKLSKTSGTVIDPVELGEKYGVDCVRYFLLREIPLGEDGNFSIDSLVERHNRELANDLGNLVNRALSLAEKKLGGKVPEAKTDPALSAKLNLGKISGHMDALETHNALAEIFSFVSACNKYVNDKEPWVLEGKEAEKVLYSVLDSVRVVAVLLQPFMPTTSERIARQLNVELDGLAGAEFSLLEPGTRLGKREILFAKIEAQPEKRPAVPSREIQVEIEPRLGALGLRLATAIVEGISVKKKHEGLEKRIRETVKAADLGAVENGEVLKGYLELYDAVGVPRQRHAVANLVEIVRQSGKLPTINTVVDSYNLVSLSRGLVVGAHDLDRIEGDVRVKTADGSEIFMPLGQSERVPVAKGEYVFVDSGNSVLCRLDVKQGDRTKVTNSTQNIFLYVQGNGHTPQHYLDEALEEICGNIVKYCGGKWRKMEVK